MRRSGGHVRRDFDRFGPKMVKIGVKRVHGKPFGKIKLTKVLSPPPSAGRGPKLTEWSNSV